MVIVPVRFPGSGFAATLKLTVPLPGPEAPEVMVIQAALLEAVQLQVGVVVTVTLPVPPPTAKFCEVGAIE
jgi:hypothetical protein